MAVVKHIRLPNNEVVDINDVRISGIDTVVTSGSNNVITSGAVYDALEDKQDTLVSGTNIKTINNQSILGSGNISIEGGSVSDAFSYAFSGAFAGGISTTDCVHKTGDESIAGDKTFTDDIIVGSASNIKYSGSGGGGGFTRHEDAQSGVVSETTLSFAVAGEPKAFVIVSDLSEGNEGALMIVGDSTGVHGIYNTGSQHNYSASFTKSYSSGTLTITAPAGINYYAEYYKIVYYTGDGTLTFKTSQIQPGSGITAVTFTGTDLTEVPAMYAIFLESAVNNEQYRRVAGYTNSAAYNSSVVPLGITFYTNYSATDTTSSFSVSYNNGLYINSGGMNAGGYFHNPGTYVLYYLMASDVAGGGSGGYQSLGDELDDKYTLPSSGIPKSDLASAVQTSLGRADTALQSYTETDPVFVASAAHGISSTDISNWNAKQKAITVSTSTPTSSQGSNGDIWIVI